MGRPAIPEASRRRLDAAVERLRSLVPATWGVRVARRTADGGDVLVVGEDGTESRIATVTRKRLDPRSVERIAFTELPAMVYAEWLSPRTRDLLRERRVGYLDGTGNADLRLSRPALMVRTDGADRDPDPKATSGPTLRGPRAWALMRTMAEVRPPYTAGDLAAFLGIDKGYVSKVLQALAANRLIDRAPRGPVTDVAWEPLIRRIASSYSMFDSNETSTWVASSGPAQLLDDLTGKNTRRWAVSGSFAASGLISVTAPTVAVIYTDDAERLAKLARLLPTDTGANVVLAEPFDPIVFDRTGTEGSYPRVSAAQTAIDLLTGNARMPSEGEQLLEAMQRSLPSWQHEHLRRTP
ncbi:MAG: hypothetical protein ACK5OX_01435 [Desertimonas sp.]